MSREDILEAAAQIISVKGFHGTSMQDIAKAVDLRKASLYHHISSKQEILVELLDTALDMLIEELERVVSQPVSPEEKFRFAMRSYVKSLTENHDLSTVLIFEHRSLEPKFRRRHIPKRDRYETLWREIIEEGVSKKVFNSQDPLLDVKFVLGVANWTIMWYDPGGTYSADQIADRSTEMLLSGLKIRKK